MALRHTVASGDSLWGLAHRYLGGGPRWPAIMNYHNGQAARFGSHSQLIPIENPNLIYVGQTLMIPSRVADPDPVTGQKADAKAIATEIDLKIEYEADENNNPISYVPKVTPDYTIETTLFGKVSLEISNPDRYRRNLELVLSRDEVALQQNLEKDCHQAYAALTKSIEVGFDLHTNKITLKTPIATNAKIGPYTLEAKVEGPNHLKATVKPQTITGTIEKAGCKFKYTADIAFKVDVTLHPTPKGSPEAHKDTAYRTHPAYRENFKQPSTNEEMVKLGVAGTILVIVYLYLTKGIPPQLLRFGSPVGPGLRNGYRYNMAPLEA